MRSGDVVGDDRVMTPSEDEIMRRREFLAAALVGLTAPRGVRPRAGSRPEHAPRRGLPRRPRRRRPGSYVRGRGCARRLAQLNDSAEPALYHGVRARGPACHHWLYRTHMQVPVLYATASVRASPLIGCH